MRSVLAILLLAATATPALAQRADQVEAYRAMREGRIRPLGEILSRIPPDRRRAFIGSEFAPGGDRYRLKFMDRGELSSVDVDARTGEIMRDRDPRAYGRDRDRGRVDAYDERRGDYYDGPPRGRYVEDRMRGGYDEDRQRAMDDRRARAFEDRQRSYDDRPPMRGYEDRRGPPPGSRGERMRRYYARPDR